MDENQPSRPVLEAIREILKFKDYTTVSEIAKVTGLSVKETLIRINKNGHMVWRHRSNGRITRVDPKGVLRDQLWKSGAYFRETSYDYGCTTGLQFEGHEELRAKLIKKMWGGGLGDSYEYEYIPDTEENRQALVDDGCVAFSAIEIDDRLWKED